MPSVRVKVPDPIVALRLATGVVVRDACAPASCDTVIALDRPDDVAPGNAVADRTAVLELAGCVTSVPPDTRPSSAEAKPVIVLFRVATPEICVVSVDALPVSASVLAANSAETRLVTSVDVSTPDPVPSDVSSCCVAVWIAPVVVVDSPVVVVIACPLTRYRRLSG